MSHGVRNDVKWDIVSESDAEFTIIGTDDTSYNFATKSCSIEIIEDATAIVIVDINEYRIILYYEDIQTPVSSDIYDLVENRLDFMF